MGRSLPNGFVIFLLVTALAIHLAGCGDDDDSGGTIAPCEPPGAIQPCDCPQGVGLGLQSCQPDGIWGQCDCSSAGGGTGGAGAGGAGAGGAGAGGAGAGGAGGAGEGGAGAGGAGEGGAGAGGIDGGVDAGALDGGALDGALDGGALDGALDGGDAAADGGGTVPTYGECIDDDECSGAGAFCYQTGGGTPSAGSPGFCTIDCSATSCPDPTDGTATTQCSTYGSAPDRCVLDCSSGTCPTDMECGANVADYCDYP